MDRIYRHQRHIYDLTRKYYLLGRDDLIAALEPPAGGSVLEIGCGTGRNLIQVARRYPSARLFGLDISSEILATGRAHVARAGLAGRINLARGDATAFDAASLFGQAAFDRVFISYSLSMIPEWRKALAAALACVASGGRLSVVDFGQLENLPAWFRQALFAWLARFHVTPRVELSRAIAMLAMDKGYPWRVGPLYRGYAWYGTVESP
jgi:S-adenosylmethionine-diacylgycerolhomoserine-N-methlytransferase